MKRRLWNQEYDYWNQISKKPNRVTTRRKLHFSQDWSKQRLAQLKLRKLTTRRSDRQRFYSKPRKRVTPFVAS